MQIWIDRKRRNHRPCPPRRKIDIGGTPSRISHSSGGSISQQNTVATFKFAGNSGAIRHTSDNNSGKSRRILGLPGLVRQTDDSMPLPGRPGFRANEVDGIVVLKPNCGMSRFSQANTAEGIRQEEQQRLAQSKSAWPGSVVSSNSCDRHQRYRPDLRRA